MNESQLREIIQLILSAKHYYDLAKRRLSKMNPISLRIKIEDLAKNFGSLTWSKNAYDLLIIVSYLSSFGIRLSTIYEVLNIKPNIDELYKRKPLNPKNICFFLRDNVCHKEPGSEDKEHFMDRQRFLNELTIQGLYKYVSKALVECKKMILEFSANYNLLEIILKRKFKNI